MRFLVLVTFGTKVPNVGTSPSRPVNHELPLLRPKAGYDFLAALLVPWAPKKGGVGGLVVKGMFFFGKKVGGIPSRVYKTCFAGMVEDSSQELET